MARKTAREKTRDAELAEFTREGSSTSPEEVIRELKRVYADAVKAGNFPAQNAALDKLAKVQAMYRTDRDGAETALEVSTDEFLADLRETLVNDDVIREWLRAELEAYDAARGGPPARPVVAGEGAQPTA